MLTVLFFILSVLNVVFTTFIAYEQITMFYKELLHNDESKRVERFLALKDRPLSMLDESQLKVELTYPNDPTQRGRFFTILILLTCNTGLCMLPYSTTQIIITMIGSITSPLVIFMLPGFLFYSHSKSTGLQSIHSRLSLAMVFIGIILLISMTSISLYVIRVELFPPENETALPPEL